MTPPDLTQDGEGWLQGTTHWRPLPTPPAAKEAT